jgi:hypothetical protein
VQPIVVVLDPEHSLLLSGRLNQLHSPLDGRIHCPLSHDVADLENISNALLFGLGKRATGRDLGRDAPFKHLCTQAWLDGDKTGDVLLSGVERLTPRARSAIRELTSRGQRRLWLISDRLHPKSTIRSELEPTVIDVAEFDRSWDNTQPATQPARLAPYPTVPNVEFIRFRITCQRELESEAFNQVDATWKQTFAAVSNWLPRVGPDREEHIATRLRELVGGCGDYFEAVVALRAAQVALFLKGYLLKLDLNTFATAAELASAADLQRGLATRLRWYTSPARPAAALIRLLAPDVSLSEIAELTPADVDADGAVIRLADRRIEVPESGRGILRAQLALLDLLGCDAPPLLLYKRGTELRAPEPRIIKEWLRQLTLETGAILAEHYTDRRRRTSHDWLHRRGISFRPLDP